MKRPGLLFAVALLLAGCAAAPPEPADAPLVKADALLVKADALLVTADAKLIAQDYRGALGSYGEFVTAAPEHPQAARVRATQTALERMIALELELSSVQQTGELTRRAVSDRQTESERLRSESERLKSEVTKLRADLERLRNIDLQTVRPENKK